MNGSADPFQDTLSFPQYFPGLVEKAEEKFNEEKVKLQQKQERKKLKV